MMSSIAYAGLSYLFSLPDPCFEASMRYLSLVNSFLQRQIVIVSVIHRGCIRIKLLRQPVQLVVSVGVNLCDK